MSKKQVCSVIGGCVNVVLLCIVCIEANAQSPNPSEDGGFEIEREVRIETATPDRPTIEVDIGTVESGRNGTIRLRIANPYSRSFSIKRIVVGCACLSAKSSSDLIAPNSDIGLELVLKTPKATKSAEQRQVILLEEESGSGKGIHLYLKFSISGLLCFEERIATVNFLQSDPNVSFRIPIKVTHPIKTEDISIAGSGGLKGIVARVENSEKHGANLFCEVKVTEGSDVAGEITISDSKSGRTDTIPCFLREQKLISISPSVVRFKRDENNSEDVAASVLVKVSDSIVKSSQGKEILLSISCAPEIGSVSVEKTRIAEGIYRLKLTYKYPPEVTEDKLRFEANWSGSVGKHDVKDVTVFSVPLRKVDQK